VDNSVQQRYKTVDNSVQQRWTTVKNSGQQCTITVDNRGGVEEGKKDNSVDQIEDVVGY